MPNNTLRKWIIYTIDKGELRSWVKDEMREMGKNPEKQHLVDKQPLYTRQEINAEMDAMLLEGELVKGEKYSRNDYFLHSTQASRKKYVNF